jgi:hypothetical protein
MSLLGKNTIALKMATLLGEKRDARENGEEAKDDEERL